jgi:nitrile hydratase accessory protein
VNAEPPRANGELMFEQPWESRAFGMAQALRRSGAIDYERFRAALIAEIAGDTSAGYYEHWQAALERVLAEHGIVEPDELDARVEAHDGPARVRHPH